MNVVEEGLEWLVEHMCEVVLELLRPLDIHEVVRCSCEPIQFSLLEPIEPISQVILWVLHFQLHIPTNTSTLGILLHICPHSVNSVAYRLQSDV